jgi:hypothetical protein
VTNSMSGQFYALTTNSKTKKRATQHSQYTENYV